MCHGGQNRRNLATGLCILSCAWLCFGEKGTFFGPSENVIDVVGGGISLGHNLKIKSSLQSWRGFGICPNHKYSARSDVWQIEQKLKKDFIFSCSIAFARLVSSALLLSESTRPPSRIVLGQRPATMCTLWMLYFHFKSQITPKKPSLNLPYFLSAQTKHCQHLKIFHPLKPLPTRMSSLQEYPQDFINSQETSSNLLGFYFVDKVDKDPPFLSLNRCLPMLKNNGFISQIIDESENWVIVKSRHLWLVCKLSALLLLPVTQPGNCWSHLHRARVSQLAACPH